MTLQYTWKAGDTDRDLSGPYEPCYRAGIRAWWRHLWGHRIIGPDLLPALFQRDRERRHRAWRALWRRGRFSARLRQCDIERDYWFRVAHNAPRGKDYGHTL
jgi:hypothetical protein